MTGNMEALYQELILDHARTPEGKGLRADAAATSHQLNPACGDEITLGVTLDGDRITAISWDGHGCAISQASASLLTGLAADASVDDTLALAADFREALRSRGSIPLDEERFGDAAALSGVSKYVARVKCAMLAWVAMEDALRKR